MIKSIEMLAGEFKGTRTAYSSNSIFLCILSNPTDKYDVESIGEKIFPDGFGSIEPPGPSFGFGSIVLTETESNGRILLKELNGRKDDEGNTVSGEQIKEALEDYMDAYFKVDAQAKKLVQISFKDFYELAMSGTEYKVLHLCEFEPDEDFSDDDWTISF